MYLKIIEITFSGDYIEYMLGSWFLDLFALIKIELTVEFYSYDTKCKFLLRQNQDSMKIWHLLQLGEGELMTIISMKKSKRVKLNL